MPRRSPELGKEPAGVRFPVCCDEENEITIANSPVYRNYLLEIGTVERRLRVFAVNREGGRKRGAGSLFKSRLMHGL